MANASAVPAVVVTASTEFQAVAAAHIEMVYTLPTHIWYWKYCPEHMFALNTAGHTEHAAPFAPVPGETGLFGG